MPSTRSSEDDLEQPNPEIERFIRYIRLQRRIRESQRLFMANNNRPLKDYAVPSEEEPHSSIVSPTVEARNFELKPALLQIVQQNQFNLIKKI